MKKLLFLCVFISVTTAFLYIYLNYIFNSTISVSSEVIFQIEKGDSLNKIAHNLKENNLIREKWKFILYSKINRLYPQVKAGEYLINDDVSIKSLADLLSSGKVFHRKLTIPEGVTSFEAMRIINENEFLTGDFVEFSEGEILPETYTFSKGSSRKSIVDKAKEALNNTLEKAWNQKIENLPIKSKRELLILASIIEKETGLPEERAQVASVFINRLKLGMLLQTDPTVIYAVTLGKEELNRPIYKKDLEIDSPYNTYKYAGLPPTPICNPGKDAIWAASHPDNTPYLYFVASGTGGHNFAKSLSEHNKNVRTWRKISK